jgi:hypothetical protein
MNPDRRRSWIGVLIATAACAVCCAGPLITLIGGIGIVSAVGAWFVPALIGLAALAIGGAAVPLWFRRRRRACPTPAAVADLGMPAVPMQRRTER